MERAVVCYREALADDPSQAAAKARLDVLRTVLQRKVGDTRLLLFPLTAMWLFLEKCIPFFFMHTCHKYHHYFVL